MKNRTTFYVGMALVLMLGLAALAPASTVTVSTPAGQMVGGQPVDATATVTTGAGTVTIAVDNNIVDPVAVIQNVSDLFLTLSGDAGTGSLTGSAGLERTVNSNGTFTDGSVVSTGWVLENLAGPIYHLNGLGAAAFVPAHTIIGEPAGSGTYASANNSIAGNGPHNPFLAGTVTFDLAIAGVTADTTLTSFTFSFGTVAGNDVPVPTPGIPLPAAGWAGLSLLGLLGAMRWNRSRV